MIFNVKLADKYIQIEGSSAELKEFLKDYLTQGHTPDFSISCTHEEIVAEQEETGETYSYDYLETLAILRKLSDILPTANRLLIHGASISYQGKAYLFSAPSGTGKSTHIRLWRKYLGQDVGIVNGDKPFVALDEEVLIYGTPWAGKENWHKNCCFPLEGICFLQRGTRNTIRKLSPAEALPLILKQVYMPKNPFSVGQTLDLIDQLLKRVPCYLLHCDISEEAVCCSFETLTHSSYLNKEKPCR